MDYTYSELSQKAQAWAQQAHSEGWLGQDNLVALAELAHATPRSLFADNPQRPLVVAFFGGTGVGKSTLLNRLAGQEIARTGVERPTSREISVYVHADIAIDRLDAELPLAEVRIARHHYSNQHNILWLDMPDIDSTASHNRELVLQWLPQIDVVIYVVSPERYRDQRGWRLLQSHGHQHAWLFIMNQWDRADPAQLEDFRGQLAGAGFDSPIVLRTDCRSEPAHRPGDDFPSLQNTLENLANAHTIRQLEQRGLRLRLTELERILGQCLERLGDDRVQAELSRRWEAIWKETEATLLDGLEWPIQQTAQAYVSRDANRLSGIPQPADDNSPRPETKHYSFWDDWAQTRVDDALDRLLLEIDASGLAVKPFRTQLMGAHEHARKTIIRQAEQGLRGALAQPAGRLRRFGLKLTGLLSVLLPLGAISWVGYQVFMGYYTSSFSNRPYLGTNFAIHSTLLIGIAWLLPWFLHRRLRPSLDSAAHQGLKRGLRLGLDTVQVEIQGLLHNGLTQRDAFLEQGRQLVRACARTAQAPTCIANPTLARMLPRQAGSKSA